MIAITFLVGLMGLAMGSFIDAFTWRLRHNRNFVSDRSECENCHHILSPKDLVPVLSWLSLKGRCRYCNIKLSSVAPITEVTMCTLFVASLMFWPFGLETWQGIALLVMWLVYLVMLGALFVYDLRWMLLPDSIVIPLIISAFGYAALRVSLMPHVALVDYAFIAVDALALAMVYWILHTASQGRWVGYGDVKLAIFMGLVLGWKNALLAFGLANLVGFLIVVPGMLSGKLNRKSQMPFGPFLIIGTVIAALWGDKIISWYLSMLGMPVGS